MENVIRCYDIQGGMKCKTHDYAWYEMHAAFFYCEWNDNNMRTCYDILLM